MTSLSQEACEEGAYRTDRLRPALAAGVEVMQPDGADYWVIRVPKTSRFFRLGEREKRLTDEFNGQQTAAEIAASLTEAWSAQVSAEGLLPILQQLAGAGLLDAKTTEGLEAETSSIPATRSPNRQSLVFFKLKAIDPSRILDRLYPYVRPLFTRFAATIYLGLFALAVTMAATNFGIVVDQGDQLIGGVGRIAGSLALVYAVNIPFIFAHEFAHAFMARNFGLRVREMGFLLIFFNPALYADVSEAWGASRRIRMLVGFAGIALNLTVSALAFLAWLWVFRGTLVGEALFILALVSSINSVFNLNPLIRLDGYYLLADWLRIPNLRTRSFKVLRDLIKGSLSTLRSFPKRERKIYVVYGIVGGIYSVAIILFAIYWSSLRLGSLIGPEGRVIGALIIPTLFVLSFALRRLPAPSQWRRRSNSEPALSSTARTTSSETVSTN